MPPFFSIGVTTYKRTELLKETLSSILRQTFTDYEVIVGNDYTQEAISGNRLGLADRRIRFVNHGQNLGEMRNMNFLLEVSRGRYFTWLADDDMYAPDFLLTVYATLVRFGYPPCVFSSYMMGATYSADRENGLVGEQRLLTGRQFLQQYLVRSLKTQGCYGVFEIQYLRRIGGMEQLGNGFSPYSDVLLAIRSGLLQKVVYIDAPLIFFRTHEESISHTSPDLDAYCSAHEDLCRKCVTIFGSEGLRDDFCSNLYLLLRWCIGDLAAVVRRSGSINGRQLIAYLIFANGYMRFLRGSILYWKAVGLLIKTMLGFVLGIGKGMLRQWVILFP